MAESTTQDAKHEYASIITDILTDLNINVAAPSRPVTAASNGVTPVKADEFAAVGVEESVRSEADKAASAEPIAVASNKVASVKTSELGPAKVEESVQSQANTAASPPTDGSVPKRWPVDEFAAVAVLLTPEECALLRYTPEEASQFPKFRCPKPPIRARPANDNKSLKEHLDIAIHQFGGLVKAIGDDWIDGDPAEESPTRDDHDCRVCPHLPSRLFLMVDTKGCVVLASSRGTPDCS